MNNKKYIHFFYMDAELEKEVIAFENILKSKLLPTSEQQSQINLASDYIKGKRKPIVINNIDISSLLNDEAKRLYARQARLKTQQQQQRHQLAEEQMERIFSQPISQKRKKRTGVPIVFTIKPPPIQRDLRFQWRLK